MTTTTTEITFEQRTIGAWRYIATLPDGVQYMTNNEGEGLFRKAGWGRDIIQVRGCGQYHARSLAAFRKTVLAIAGA